MSVWKFARLEAIENTVFNNALEKFYGLGVDGLVRENIQNAMDAKLIDNITPVEVYIELGEVYSSNIPGIDEIRDRICHLKGENNYSRGTIEHMKREQGKLLVPYISFEDSNTRGLTGAKNGQNFHVNDTWGAYAYKKGVHPQEDDEEKESLRGGSHGIGKIASNAASDLHIMFFANCDENGDKHLGGTVQLIEHQYNGEFYRDTGYFSDEIGNVLYPYENKFGNIFKKDTRGLKIIIPFLRKQNNDEKSVICSVCDNFFIAIIEKN
ncbi:hypothetical protein SAMN02745248_00490 [Hathewaya proteolytica DSM 3090]|uniref:Uncharacterized protein n=1 Tax=Hathewaya proteolytica DSM 3090 TaxID=1121331 RepID=A0A1M6KJA2_9CLOT|nr:hypothetical protein [Hathewaya proteolytica]SHJ59005.1 hypothetical protein SAMN02745248_00490 [Hathewaya proteolytica DSM 3090]